MDWKKWLVRGSLGFLGVIVVLAMFTNSQADKKRPQVNFTVDVKTDAVPAESIKAAITAFAESCQPLTTKHWENVKSATAVVAPVPDFAKYLLAKGWTYMIEVEIALADRTDIPVTEEYGVPDGHHLFYTLGGGPNPGFFAAKDVSQALCGMPVNQKGVKAFRDLPALSVLP
ncbi:hypothetical protein [Magnetospirillum sp. UT-4]|uniref:hypothetical protein n=1 Tax=Magnetospirillum sp. UT-4 TaxID=2681467 RepID=UPI001380DFDA|nr:hypothetical protein [Magnetospirillum sp. UT-4]CAA7614617.1 exported hypothetical protein [Magnetospirillum sp. UT-4]